MPKITPFLWFNNNAEEAINFYISIFPNSKIVSLMGPKGAIIGATFVLDGQEFRALNGGPHYKLTPAFSLFVDLDTQKEVDELWDKLIAGGGKPSRCGWLEDRFGLSWQVIPRTLGKLLGDKDPQKSKRVMDAMLKMVKIDIKKLKDAYAGK
jgi:predicted 3-demethylubiquinone-9 3-methyltransferase (glyoxalase superfamily)